MELSKEKRIQEEKLRLAALFWDVPKNRFFALIGLIEQAAFLKVALEDLQETILREGGTEQYQNGANQSGTKISSALDGYNKTTKTYQKVISQLMDYISHDSAMRPPNAHENEYQALIRFRQSEDCNYYLSEEFKSALEKNRAKVLELLLEGN